MPSGFEDDFPVFDKDRTEGYGVADIIIQRLLSGHIANDQLIGVVDADNRREFAGGAADQLAVVNDDAVSGAAIAVAAGILKAAGVDPGDRVVVLNVFFDGIARRSGIHIWIAGDEDAGWIVDDHQLAFKGRAFQINDLDRVLISAGNLGRLFALVSELRIADRIQFGLGIEQPRGLVLQAAFCLLYTSNIHQAEN